MISLAQKYYLVTNDRFELFYRGVIKSHDPYKYYVKATCEKGYTYKRYFTYTPRDGEEGEYKLLISIIDDEGKIIEEKETLLVVKKPVEEKNKINILCIGDSLTVNGVWPKVGFDKYNEYITSISGENNINFIGKMKKDKVGYEGYGGWQWYTFGHDYDKSQTSSVWVTCNHDKDDTDQHSTWKNGDKEWILETIEEKRLKFKRGKGNDKINPELTGPFTSISETNNNSNILFESYEYSAANPFWNKQEKRMDFNKYVTDNGYQKIDYVFILLTWNGQYKPYNTDFSVHDEYSSMMIETIHQDYPEAKIGILGIQLPCPNGGMTACYGASRYYHDWYGETITAFNYDEFLEKKCNSEKYKDYVVYFDTKAQFDSEYNFYTKDIGVNNRNNEITERIGVNGIHPSMNGYLQIGDSFYRALIHMLQMFKK